jgi:hypothetical protein
MERQSLTGKPTYAFVPTSTMLDGGAECWVTRVCYVVEKGVFVEAKIELR